MDSTPRGHDPQDNDLVDAGDIAYVCWAIRQIEDAGLLRDFEITVGKELFELAQRQPPARWRLGDATGRYVAKLLGADVQRCERIAVGTRAAVVRAEIEVYLGMIRQRDERDAAIQSFEEWTDARYGPAGEVPELEDAAAEPPAEGPIMIRSADQVPVSVRLAQAKRRRA